MLSFCSYRYSKATALVYLWSLCVFASVWCSAELKDHLYGVLQVSGGEFHVRAIVPISTLVVAIPLSGWLADQRFGNFRVFKGGCVLMFLGSLLLSLGILVLKNLDSSGEESFITSIVVAPLASLVFFSGGSACLVTVFQLGLDQMPDASSTDVISYILWYFITISVGFWSSNSLYHIIQKCCGQEPFIQVWGLYPMFCTSIVLCTLFVFGKKWLIIEPKSPQSLKNIYRVLKFAAKHKAPINRSAFTYWEKDIPSRLDLGKSRYGGPFTFEQVEDVKTFFRLLTLFFPIWVTVFSENVYGTLHSLYSPLEFSQFSQNSSCTYTVFSMFTYNPYLCSMVTLILYKFFIYQIFKHRLGSSLKRICHLTIMVFFLNIGFSTFSIISLVSTDVAASQWPFFIYSILSYSAFSLFVAFTVEFVCAQSPYSMRGLLSGIVFFTIILSAQLGYFTYLLLTHHCAAKYCSVVQYSIGAAFSAFGLLLQIIVARRYKRRVRDEGYYLYEQVKDVFSRYLSQSQ